MNHVNRVTGLRASFNTVRVGRVARSSCDALGVWDASRCNAKRTDESGAGANRASRRCELYESCGGKKNKDLFMHIARSARHMMA